MLETIGPSLVVTAIAEDIAWIEQLLESPSIDRLNIEPSPTKPLPMGPASRRKPFRNPVSCIDDGVSA